MCCLNCFYCFSIHCWGECHPEIRFDFEFRKWNEETAHGTRVFHMQLVLNTTRTGWIYIAFVCINWDAHHVRQTNDSFSASIQLRLTCTIHILNSTLHMFGNFGFNVLFFVFVFFSLFIGRGRDISIDLHCHVISVIATMEFHIFSYRSTIDSI